jgi:hypothetical protein
MLAWMIAESAEKLTWTEHLSWECDKVEILCVGYKLSNMCLLCRTTLLMTLLKLYINYFVLSGNVMLSLKLCWLFTAVWHILLLLCWSVVQWILLWITNLSLYTYLLVLVEFLEETTKKELCHPNITIAWYCGKGMLDDVLHLFVSL